MADSKEERAESVKRQLSETKSGQPGQTASPADEQPVSEDQLTDKTPDSPKGVGTSTTRRGEDMKGDEGQEAGRQDAGTKGESDRPVGTSDERDLGGVDPDDS